MYLKRDGSLITVSSFKMMCGCSATRDLLRCTKPCMACMTRLYESVTILGLFTALLQVDGLQYLSTIQELLLCVTPCLNLSKHQHSIGGIFACSRESSAEMSRARGRGRGRGSTNGAQADTTDEPITKAPPPLFPVRTLMNSVDTLAPWTGW